MPALLSQLLRESDANTLWIADENAKALLTQGFSFSGTLLSNRWDLVQAALQCGITAIFSDFELAKAGSDFSQIIYPVSKEKAAVHHVINSAPLVLRENGELILLGSKNSGIKTYAQKAAQYLGTQKSLQKHGTEYLSRNNFPVGTTLGAPLDDSEYPWLRALIELDGLYSKPGLFGWNKIDVGSALLANHLADHMRPALFTAVDLGCGYGYLSRELSKLAPQAHILATDNNAAALLACEKNFTESKIPGEVIPGDAGSEIASASADMILCNPPFHQGFQVEGDLTTRFLDQAARILRPKGTALFVVNEFIPLGKKAEERFQQVELLEKARGFCIYRLLR
ncbi:class I SAM-dependent methyltransferase [Microbulbifer sp. HZ11]|uniref:class I SAM-dependent methyltransferase n=1 Tax=unclassified Microbulbifer TaxID=2619833 RepID=UPI00068DDFE9|nr:methyltransferase [Microbulbifer sp. HZ11]